MAGGLTAEDEDYLERNFERTLKAFEEDRKSLGRTLFVLGTGTLVLSLNFLATSTLKLVFIPWLIVGWSSLTFATFTYLASILYSFRQHEAVMDEINNRFADGTHVEDGYDPEDNEAAKKYKSLWVRLTSMTIALLALGIFSMLIFATANLIARQQVDQQLHHPHHLR